ncbi:Enterobacterial putative membrane protein (DUF943) [Serratia rubidaea]|uniref:Enterobacterial putative membrane protein (DUF943) n=2 Tax=Serratia rubidaea TaxID=61652 RepID=A0A4V6JHD5_SERRU|nr:DUF943 family protein [Serratia rubidaea]QPR62004.1 DUF943 family protein [Serratia rubidaea]CAI0952504.1 Enterobacterial putative membrane protein (DUF943) [Serratia rubidaea]CAI1733059.1 Enterobacterial putative membrane protein (DUF943) [Serratia rubidaea]VTP61263.1 Enterobacterial putative membrane protein (DUF943) [Serratia rubidaea]HAY0636872.1 DUF943 family protein [Serratia rubidaea]
MNVKNKKTKKIILIMGCIFLGYILWLLLRPVKIVAVHEDGNFSSVLVKSFPFTTRGKIEWWLQNKDMLKERYGIPKPASYGNFSITFWLFGDGYKEEGKYDRRCFSDMKTKVNCIEKDIVLNVRNSKNMGVVFFANGGIYRIDKNGKITKVNID